MPLLTLWVASGIVLLTLVALNDLEGRVPTIGI